MRLTFFGTLTPRRAVRCPRLGRRASPNTGERPESTSSLRRCADPGERERREREYLGVPHCPRGTRGAGGGPGADWLSLSSGWLRRSSSPGAERRQQHLHPRGERQAPHGRPLPSARLPKAPCLTSRNLADGAEGTGSLEFQLCVRTGPWMWDAPRKGPFTQRSQSSQGQA